MYGVEKFKSDHVTNYRKALIEIIVNNTNALFDEDISSLLKKPPLDSMDVIKTKFLDLAKKNKIVLNAETLTKMVDTYRDKCLKLCSKLKDLRVDELTNKVNDFVLEKDTDTIKLAKKDFSVIDKKIRSEFKELVKDSLEKEVFSKIDKLFSKDVDEQLIKKITTEAMKFINNNYQKQLLENIDFKILVKDTILISSFKEQGERYLFTLENSRIFNVE